MLPYNEDENFEMHLDRSVFIFLESKIVSVSLSLSLIHSSYLCAYLVLLCRVVWSIIVLELNRAMPL